MANPRHRQRWRGGADHGAARRWGRLVAVAALAASLPRPARADDAPSEGAPPSPSPRVLWVRISGNAALSSREIESRLKTRVGERVDPDRLREDREAITARYEREGFLLVEVRSSVLARGRGHAGILFRVREGPRVALEDLVFSGARSFSHRELIAAGGLEPRRLLGLLSGGRYLSGSATRAVRALRAFYLSRGFFDARVELERFELGPRQRRATVRVRVEEGPRYEVVGCEVSGQKLFPSELLLGEIDLPLGVPYDGREVAAAGRRLSRAYQERSDVAARIRVRRQYGEGATVTVRFEIEERPALFTGKVRVEGNRVTRDDVVRADLAVMPGEVLRPRDIEESHARLTASGLFKAASIRVVPTDEEKVRDVEVSVEERERYGWFELGGGASSGAGEVAYVHAQSRNFDLWRLPRSLTDWEDAFTGGGQTAEVEVIPGSRESFYRALWREPRFLDSSRSLTLSGGTLLYTRESYDESRLRASAELRQYLEPSRRLSALFSWTVEGVKIDGLDATAPADVQAASGSTFLSVPALALRLDDSSLNRYSGPRGIVADLRLDLAHSGTGSEAEFLRATARADWFATLLDRVPDRRHALHLGVEAGWIEGLGEPVPIHERFFTGGPRSFRGFRYRGLGPHSAATPLGGRFLLRTTLEYSFPIFWREVRAVVLLDAGFLEGRPRDVGFDRFRVAAGGGLQLRTPVPFSEQVMPVNLYWTRALASEAGDEEELFGFTLGFGF